MRQSLLILVAATLYLSLSGFECASPQVSTARVALGRKDYKAAEEALKKEVTQNPMNGEAWKLLGDVYYEQGRYVDMDRSFASALNATTPSVKENDKTDIVVKRYNAWLTTYNLALESYNKGVTADSSHYYQKALSQIDTAVILRPGYPENLFIRATLLGVLKRNEEVRRVYTEYVTAIRPNVEQGVKLGLALGQTPQQVEAKLGKATKKKVVDSVGGFDFYQPQNLYVYYIPSGTDNRMEVVGWRFFTESAPDFVKESQLPLRTTAYYILGVEAYRDGEKNKARYDDALKYLQTVQQLEPQREGIGQLISEIYINSGRTAEAKQLLEQQIRENPKEASSYINYGNLLFEAKDFTRAADQFRKVLDLGLKDDDRNLTVALFNLGAVYKNLGANIQDSIRTVTTAPSASQIELYRKPLRESVKYFERLEGMGGQSDYKLLTELGNLYEVLGDKAQVQRVLTQLEKIDSANSTDPQYYRALSRFYVIIGDEKKAEAADRKSTELLK